MIELQDAAAADGDSYASWLEACEHVAEDNPDDLNKDGPSMVTELKQEEALRLVDLRKDDAADGGGVLDNEAALN